MTPAFCLGFADRRTNRPGSLGSGRRKCEGRQTQSISIPFSLGLNGLLSRTKKVKEQTEQIVRAVLISSQIFALQNSLSRAGDTVRIRSTKRCMHCAQRTVQMSICIAHTEYTYRACVCAADGHLPFYRIRQWEAMGFHHLRGNSGGSCRLRPLQLPERNEYSTYSIVDTFCQHRVSPTHPHPHSHAPPPPPHTHPTPPPDPRTHCLSVIHHTSIQPMTGNLKRGVS